MRRVQRHQVKEVNSLWYWYKTVNPFKVVINFIVIYFARFIPHLPLKNFLYRLIGMKVGKNVSVGLMAMFDIFFPELIEIGDNSIIGYNSTILAHEVHGKGVGYGKGCNRKECDDRCKCYGSAGSCNRRRHNRIRLFPGQQGCAGKCLCWRYTY